MADELPPPKKGRVNKKGALVGLIGLTAASLYVGTLDMWEGNELTVYRDSIGIPTVCRGLTRDDHNLPFVLGRRYTQADCDRMNEAEAYRHMVLVLKVIPTLKDGCPRECLHPYQIAAAGSLGYNIGITNLSKSTVAKEFNRRNWVAGCDAFIKWDKAGGREIRGLLNRRVWEKKQLCYVGI